MVPPPKPPATMLGIERFIASAMRLVRIEPDAPTIMPATISAVLLSAMPVAAAPTNTPRHDHARVVERDAGRRRAQAGERVEQGDDHGHVGAADRQHHE